MNYYHEITLLPDAEISLSFIWQNVFQQVHIALVENKVAPNESAIAVGFPDYQQTGFPLGSKLRLFSKEQTTLEKLAIEQWLVRLKDYVHIKAIKPVPSEVVYASFMRKHVKSPVRIERNMQKKSELWAEKSGKSLAACLAELEKTKPAALSKLPFIYLHSQQTKQRAPDKNSKFPLFIEMHQAKAEQSGVFDCYGLSSKVNSLRCLATVPHF
jgi:CRISPR-associated endonuclease Csy4